MRLETVLNNIRYSIIQGTLEKEIENVEFDSRKCQNMGLFVCIKGYSADGHLKVLEAVENGAIAVIIDDSIRDALPENVTILKVEDSRVALAKASKNFYDCPDEKLTLIGITGTKGKTSVSFLIKKILSQSGFKVGMIGTVEIDTGKRTIDSDMTTPEALHIYRYLDEMVKSNLNVCVMEVSSQSYKMHRTDLLEFDYGIFTNLGKDHISPREHVDLEEYIRCKGELFKNCLVGIINGDDKQKEKVLEGHKCNIITFGFDEKNDYAIRNYTACKDKGFLGGRFLLADRLENLAEINIPLPGEFSGMNVACAIALSRQLGVSYENINLALKDVKIPGRQEMFSLTGDDYILVDYAHNGMGLETVLKSLREYEPGRLICLFGCGGMRDKNRRRDMAKAASENADFVVVTSDNPRSEPPEDIIADIINEIKKYGKEYVVYTDRKKAIYEAISMCAPGDILLIAGKGHENYQIIGNEKFHFDDREEVVKSVEKVRKNEKLHSR